MNDWLRKNPWRWWPIPLLMLLGGYWLLPISGQIVVMPGESAPLWPQIRLAPASPQPGQETTLWITDATPWPHVLLTMDGRSVRGVEWQANPGDTWTWTWTLTWPDKESSTLVFYHDCHTGCVERGRVVVGEEPRPAPARPTPTKLGIIFANPERDWHARSGWDVELTYARLADESYWGIDGLAARVHRATANGLRVLVRVDYDQGQSIPSADYELALAEYLQYLRRLARDERLRDVYGYFLDSSYNAAHLVTPEWYARIFNGYGEEIAHTDNAVQVMRAENPQVRVLVGPLQP